MDLPRLVIGGLPRTGTTWLQVCVAERGFCTYSGEHYRPAWLDASGAPNPAEIALARSQADIRYQAVQDLAPELARMHPLGATLPEECTPILRNGGPYIPWWFMSDGVGTLEVLAASSFDEFYAEEWAAFYRVSFRGPGPLAVKSPLHFVCYEALLRSCSNVAIIQLRRHPVDQVLSTVTMVAHSRAATGNRPDRQALKRIARDWIGFLHVVLPVAEGVCERTAAFGSVALSGLSGSVLDELLSDLGLPIRFGTCSDLVVPPGRSSVVDLESAGISLADVMPLAEAYPNFFAG